MSRIPYASHTTVYAIHTLKIVVRSGTWFRYGDHQLGQGRERVRAYLREHPELTEELRTKIMESGAATLAAGGAPSESGGEDNGAAEE